MTATRALGIDLPGTEKLVVITYEDASVVARRLRGTAMRMVPS